MANYVSFDGLKRFADKVKALINEKENKFDKNTAFNKDFGNMAGTVVEGNDPRLSDAREPLKHMHVLADITDYPTDSELIEMAAEIGMVVPATSDDNEIYVDDENNVYTI